MATIQKKTIQFDSGAAKFWYDGNQISSWSGSSVSRSFPPALSGRLNTEAKWNTAYKNSNISCVLAGTIGPTILFYEDGYESRYLVSVEGQSIRYNDRTYPYNARISAIIPFVAPKENHHGYGVKATIKLRIRKGLDMPINTSEEGQEIKDYLLKRNCYGPADTFLRFSIFGKMYDGSLTGTETNKSYTITDWAGQHDLGQDGLLRLRQNGRIVPEYNEDFDEWSVEIDGRGFIPEQTYYLHLWGCNANFSNLIEIDVSNSCIEYEYIRSGVSVYDGSKIRNAIPYIHNGTEWVRAEPYIHTDENWICCI